MHDDNARLSGAELLELNRGLQASRAIRLLAATNLGLYATLMERHLNDGAVPETELVVRLERDFEGRKVLHHSAFRFSCKGTLGIGPDRTADTSHPIVATRE